MRRTVVCAVTAILLGACGAPESGRKDTKTDGSNSEYQSPDSASGPLGDVGGVDDGSGATSGPDDTPDTGDGSDQGNDSNNDSSDDTTEDPSHPEPPDTGVNDTPDIVDTECGDLEVLGNWEGTFDGILADGSGLGMSGPVTGTVTLEIVCGSNKVLVTGALVGEGCVSSCAPYTAEIDGEYNPFDATLSADIINGVVDLGSQFGQSVPFSGWLNGTFDGVTLAGEWGGSGTMQMLAIVVNGNGSWSAEQL